MKTSNEPKEQNKKDIVLWIAEKPSVALKISEILSENRMRTIQSYSKYNPIYEFEYKLNGVVCIFRITSVSGHITSLKYSDELKSWSSTDYDKLFFSKLEKSIASNWENIIKTLKQISAKASFLILWTDCDREGEGIAFDIIDVWTEVNKSI